MIFSRKQLGALGEQIALKYLRKNKYKIITTHYQKRIGEIDIIAQDQNSTLVFFEVKTRTSHKFGPPAESVNWIKQQKLIKTAYWFLKESKIENQNFRIDVLTVDFDLKSKQSKIKHFRNAVWV